MLSQVEVKVSSKGRTVTSIANYEPFFPKTDDFVGELQKKCAAAVIGERL